MSYCPICKTEYNTGITICPECNVGLLESEKKSTVPIFSLQKEDSAKRFVEFAEAEGITVTYEYMMREDAYKIYVEKTDMKAALKLYATFHMQEVRKKKAEEALQAAENTDLIKAPEEPEPVSDIPPENVSIVAGDLPEEESTEDTSVPSFTESFPEPEESSELMIDLPEVALPETEEEAARPAFSSEAPVISEPSKDDSSSVSEETTESHPIFVEVERVEESELNEESVIDPSFLSLTPVNENKTPVEFDEEVLEPVAFSSPVSAEADVEIPDVSDTEFPGKAAVTEDSVNEASAEDTVSEEEADKSEPDAFSDFLSNFRKASLLKSRKLQQTEETASAAPDETAPDLTEETVTDPFSEEAPASHITENEAGSVITEEAPDISSFLSDPAPAVDFPEVPKFPAPEVPVADETSAPELIITEETFAPEVSLTDETSAPELTVTEGTFTPELSFTEEAPELDFPEKKEAPELNVSEVYSSASSEETLNPSAFAKVRPMQDPEVSAPDFGISEESENSSADSFEAPTLDLSFEPETEETTSGLKTLKFTAPIVEEIDPKQDMKTDDFISVPYRPTDISDTPIRVTAESLISEEVLDGTQTAPEIDMELVAKENEKKLEEENAEKAAESEQASKALKNPAPAEAPVKTFSKPQASVPVPKKNRSMNEELDDLEQYAGFVPDYSFEEETEGKELTAEEKAMKEFKEKAKARHSEAMAKAAVKQKEQAHQASLVKELGNGKKIVFSDDEELDNYAGFVPDYTPNTTNEEEFDFYKPHTIGSYAKYKKGKNKEGSVSLSNTYMRQTNEDELKSIFVTNIPTNVKRTVNANDLKTGNFILNMSGPQLSKLFNSWMMMNITQSTVHQFEKLDATPEENMEAKLSGIKELLKTNFGDLNEGFLDAIVQRYYTKYLED